MLKQRLITGLTLLAIVLLAIIYLPAFYFVIVTFLLTAFASWEWSYIVGYQQYAHRLLYLLITSALMCAAWFSPVFPLLGITVLGWFVALYWVVRYPKSATVWSSRLWFRSVMGWFVLIPTWLSLSILRSSQEGISLVLFMLLIIWATDSGAYFVGRSWGKHKLIPHVSPKKTWEGFVGGVVLALFIAFMGCLALKVEPAHWFVMVLLGLVVSLFSVIGDLFESMLKRAANIKDSGNYLPGHGGILDRIDSLTSAAPIFLLALLFLRSQGIGI